MYELSYFDEEKILLYFHFKGGPLPKNNRKCFFDSSFLIAKQFDDALSSNLDDKFILSPVNSFMRMSAVKLNWIENVIRSVGLTSGSELVQCAWLYKKGGKPFLFI